MYERIKKSVTDRQTLRDQVIEYNHDNFVLNADISAGVESEAKLLFCIRHSFEGCLYREQPWKRQRVSCFGAKGKSVYYPV